MQKSGVCHCHRRRRWVRPPCAITLGRRAHVGGHPQGERMCWRACVCVRGSPSGKHPAKHAVMVGGLLGRRFSRSRSRSRSRSPLSPPSFFILPNSRRTRTQPPDQVPRVACSAHTQTRLCAHNAHTMRPRQGAAAAAAALAVTLAVAASAAPFSLAGLGASEDTISTLPSPVPLELSTLPRTSLLGYPEGAKFPLKGAQILFSRRGFFFFFFFFPETHAGGTPSCGPPTPSPSPLVCSRPGRRGRGGPRPTGTCPLSYPPPPPPPPPISSHAQPQNCWGSRPGPCSPPPTPSYP